MSAPAEHPAAIALAARHRLRWWEPIPWLLALAYYFLFPRYLGFGTDLLITILFALSLDLALGYADIITLGHAAFFGAGAYTVGMLSYHGIWTEPITSLIVVAVGGLGRVTGVFYAALIIGVLDFVLKRYLPQGGTVFIYALTILLLLWRPQGLFGGKAT